MLGQIQTPVRQLTWFFSGDVDCREEGAGARCVESADCEEILCVSCQAAHCDWGLVPRHPDLPHGLWFCVILPVNHLFFDGGHVIRVYTVRSSSQDQSQVQQRLLFLAHSAQQSCCFWCVKRNVMLHEHSLLCPLLGGSEWLWHFCSIFDLTVQSIG